MNSVKHAGQSEDSEGSFQENFLENRISDQIGKYDFVILKEAKPHERMQTK